MRNEDAIQLAKQRAASGAPDHSRGIDDPNARLTDLRKAFQRYLSGSRAEDQDPEETADPDEDFHALHALVTGVSGLDKDKDVGELRQLLADHNGGRLHAALDRVLDRVRESRRAGDHKFLRRMGVKS